MSKAFDSIDRAKLFEYLEKILQPDELHLLNVLTNTPNIQVKVGNELGRSFVTLQGIMQGDCLSAVLFIFYLGHVLLKEHSSQTSILIKPKYADDITYITNDETIYKHIQLETPALLKEGGLKVNLSKTELYEIPKPPPPPPPPVPIDELLAHKDDKVCWSALDWLVNYKKDPPPDNTPDWKKCKLLGSYLDTTKDIANRKNLSLQTMIKFANTFNSKYVSNEVKMRTFNIYIGSVFLYNSELWSLSESNNKSIDAFQRKILRRALGIRWPRKVSNNKLYQISKAEAWSLTITRRRFTFLGHIIWLPHDTPAKQALRECFKPTRRKCGRPATTWIATIKKDLEILNINIKIDDPESIKIIEVEANDRKNWTNLKKMLMQ